MASKVLDLDEEISSIGTGFVENKQTPLGEDELIAQEEQIKSILKEEPSEIPVEPQKAPKEGAKQQEEGFYETSAQILGNAKKETKNAGKGRKSHPDPQPDPDCMLTGYRLPKGPGTAVSFASVASSWDRKKVPEEKTLEDKLVSSREGMTKAKQEFGDYITGLNSVKAVPQIWEDCVPKTVQLTSTISEPAPGTRTGSRSFRVDLPKEKLIAILKNQGYQAEWVTRRSKGRWDVLLKDKQEAAKLALGGVVSEGAIRLYPEYMGRSLTQVELHEVPKFTPWGLIYVFLEQYGEVHQVTLAEMNKETKTGTYKVLMSLTQDGYVAVPDTLLVTEPSNTTEIIKISISIKGRKPRCWFCHREGHLFRDCPYRQTPHPKSVPPKNVNPKNVPPNSVPLKR